MMMSPNVTAVLTAPVLPWLAAGAALAPAPGGRTALPAPRSRAESAGAPGRDGLVLSPDLQALLGVGPGAAAYAEPLNDPRAGRHPRAAAARPTATPVAQTPYMGLLNRHLARVRTWLGQPRMAALLARRGLRRDDLLAPLRAEESRLRASLAQSERQGVPAFGLVPSAREILRSAMQAALRAQAERATTGPATTAPAGSPGPAAPTVPSPTAVARAGSASPAATVTPAATASRAPAGLSPEETALRQQALHALHEFDRDAVHRLQDLRYVNWINLPHLAAGQVSFMHLPDLIHAFPCAPAGSVVPALENGVPPADVGDDAPLQLVYPDVKVNGVQRPLGGASVARTPWQAICGDDHRVWISRDGSQWTNTGVYTDPGLEQEKLRVLTRYIERADYYIRRHQEQRERLWFWRGGRNNTGG